MIQVFCMMHVLFLCINAEHKNWDVVGPLFCGTALMHRGPVYDAFMRSVERELGRRLHLTQEQPSAADVAYQTALAKLLMWESSWSTWFSAEAPRKRTQRYQRAVAEFVVLFTHLVTSGGKILHYCPFGCCPGGKPETVRRMLECLMDLFLGKLPPVPALNRWVKLFPCMLWWTLGMLIHDIGPSSWRRAQAPQGESEERTFQQTELVDQGEDDTVRQINVSRNRRVNKWLASPETRHRLVAVVLVLLYAFDVMSRVFGDRTSEKDGPRMLSFIADDGPAQQLRRLYWALLADLDGEHWVLLRGADGWTARKLLMVSTMLLTIIGQIEMRMIRPFEDWPWRLRKLFEPDAASVVADIAQTCENCWDPFTRVLMCSDRCEVRKNPKLLLDRSHHKSRVCQRALEGCGLTNIEQELRFARQQAGTSKRAGFWHSVGQMQTTHCLGEHASQWLRALARFGAPVDVVADLDFPYSSLWQYFYARARKAFPAMSMETIGERWATLKSDPVALAQEQARFDEHRSVASSIDLAAAVTSESTPHSMGSSNWPLRREKIQHLADAGMMIDAATRFDSRWGMITWPTCETEALADDAGAPTRTCGQTFGPGICETVLTAPVLETFAAVVADLGCLARHLRIGQSKRVFCARPTGALPVEAPTCLTIVSLAGLFKDPEIQQYVVCRGGGRSVPTVGQQLRPNPDCMMDTRQVALRLAQAHNVWKFLHVRCDVRREPSFHFLVEGHDELDMDAVRAELGQKRAAKDELHKLRKLAQDVMDENPIKKRKTPTAAPKRKTPKEKAVRSPATSDESDAAVDVPPDAIDVPAPPHLPTWKGDHVIDLDGTPLGQISWQQPGGPSKPRMLAVKCRAHGCSRATTENKKPSMVGAMRWCPSSP